MSGISDHVKVIGRMTKGETPFDAAEVDAALTAIEAAAGDIPALFERPATDPKSEASPDIWDNFDDFEAKAADLETLVSERVGAVESEGDLAPLMRDLGAACKACHSDYKL